MKKRIQIQHLEKRMSLFAQAGEFPAPNSGWIKAVRTALRMTMQQLAKKLGVSKQSIADLEKREQEDAVTLRSLKEAANALDMKLVYGFVPKDGSIDNLIERKARIMAEQIVARTSNSMKLEDQENSKSRLKNAIEERTQRIKEQMPKSLWD
ncbi:MAG: mobile mystery protein A [Bacteroidetes bacterium]|nr:mobile mystery protein A [Bacteroidota bacterium]